MKCPKCGKDIERVIVVSQCWQYGQLAENSNKIVEYGSVENITDTILIECPECSQDIMKEVEQ
jgi:hypothetical protein